MATNKSLSLTSSDGTAFTVDVDKVIYAYDNSGSKAILLYSLSKGVNATPVTLTISTSALQALSTGVLFIETVIESDASTKAVCFNNKNVIQLQDYGSDCKMFYFVNNTSVPQQFIIDAAAATVSTDCTTTIPVTDDTTQEIYYLNGFRVVNTNSQTETGTILSSAVVASAGTAQLVGDILPLTGGTYTTQAKVAVATIKPVSSALNAAGTGYAAADTIVTAGGTATTPATITVSTTKLISVANLAGGSGYNIADTVTLSGGTAATKGIVTVATTKFVSAAVNAPGTGMVAGSTLLTLVGGTHSITATATVTTTKVVSATVAAGGTGNLGDGAGVIVEGTTGTGTKFRASVTIATNAIASVQSITVAGNYTVNPTAIANEPVTYISGASSGTTLTGAQLSVVMGALTVTAATAGSYTVQSTTFTTTGGGNNCTLNAALFGILTHTLSTAGSYTVNGTTFTQFATSGAGTGATFDTPIYGINTYTISAAGSYSVGTTSFTQFSTSGAGTGATFNTVVFGVNTVTVNTAGAYTTTPSNPVSQGTSSGSGVGATFTATFVSGGISGTTIYYNDDTQAVPTQRDVEQTQAQINTLINALV